MSPRTRMWSVGRVLTLRARPVLTRPESFAVSFQQQQQRAKQFTDDAGGKRPGDTTPKSFGERYGGYDPMAEQPGQEEGTAGQEAETKMEEMTRIDAKGVEVGKTGSDNFEQMFADSSEGIKDVLGDGVALAGGLTLEQEQVLYEKGVIPPATTGNPALDTLAEMSTGLKVVGAAPQAPSRKALSKLRKFPLPKSPLPWHMQMKNRYHPVLMQFTRLIMRHGKLSKAQYHVSQLLTYLRTSPPPILSPKYPLLPGHPPANHLPLNPVLYLTLAIDSVAPLMRIAHVSGIIGGGNKLEVPVPLELRQRRRVAFKWILEAVDKKPSMGSGKKQYAHRLASEIIAIVEGSSKVWEKRQLVHNTATSSRANMGRTKRKMRGGARK